MLGQRLECRQPGMLAVKGFAEPVQAWRLEGLREPDRQCGRPFVGRPAELGQFGDPPGVPRERRRPLMGDFEPAKVHAERALALVRRLGVRRFEPVSLNEQAMILRGEGRRAEALDVLHRALTISRETGISFVGPWLLGHLAVTTEDPAERRAALAKGEEVLGKGAVSHNHLWFYCYAMQAALAACEHDDAERHATALEDYTRPEPLPWAEFFIASGRALAATAAASATRRRCASFAVWPTRPAGSASGSRCRRSNAPSPRRCRRRTLRGVPYSGRQAS
jgi:hypothetical protein